MFVRVWVYQREASALLRGMKVKRGRGQPEQGNGCFGEGVPPSAPSHSLRSVFSRTGKQLSQASGGGARQLESRKREGAKHSGLGIFHLNF